eukprot:UC4_evm1s1242
MPETPPQKKVLILGAGLVCGPGVKYLANFGGKKDSTCSFAVTVASRTLSKAEAIVAGLPNAKAVAVDVKSDDPTERKASQRAKLIFKLEDLMTNSDLVVSLLPWTEHLPVAKLSLSLKKHFVTTSYIKPEMQAMDADFKAAGIVSFNECGVDPGLDHMSAMKIIDEAHGRGAKIKYFTSYCGGLPCPDDNNNPYGYKFSWSPKGVLLAAVRESKYLVDGVQKFIGGDSGNELYDNFQLDDSVPNVGEGLNGPWPKAYECHPNGDTLSYIDIYGIPEVETFIRGTYRNVGWCNTMKKIKELGLLDQTEDGADKGKSYAEMLATQAGGEVADVKAAVSAKINLATDDEIIGRMEWLGLFDATRKVEANSKIDAVCALFEDNEKFWYQAGERDMICMHHTFIIENKDGSKQKTTSTCVNYGIANGDTSMSRTVTLPMAIMIKRLLSGESKVTGVCRPTTPDIYNAILEEMEKEGVVFHEKTIQRTILSVLKITFPGLVTAPDSARIFHAFTKKPVIKIVSSLSNQLLPIGICFVLKMGNGASSSSAEASSGKKEKKKKDNCSYNAQGNVINNHHINHHSISANAIDETNGEHEALIDDQDNNGYSRVATYNEILAAISEAQDIKDLKTIQEKANLLDPPLSQKQYEGIDEALLSRQSFIKDNDSYNPAVRDESHIHSSIDQDSDGADSGLDFDGHPSGLATIEEESSQGGSRSGLIHLLPSDISPELRVRVEAYEKEAQDNKYIISKLAEKVHDLDEKLDEAQHRVIAAETRAREVLTQEADVVDGSQKTKHVEDDISFRATESESIAIQTEPKDVRDACVGTDIDVNHFEDLDAIKQKHYDLHDTHRAHKAEYQNLLQDSETLRRECEQLRSDLGLRKDKYKAREQQYRDALNEMGRTMENQEKLLRAEVEVLKNSLQKEVTNSERLEIRRDRALIELGETQMALREAQDKLREEDRNIEIHIHDSKTLLSCPKSEHHISELSIMVKLILFER